MTEQKIAYYLNFSDVIRILRLVDETSFQELQFELGDLKLRVVRDEEQPSLKQHSATRAPTLATSEAVLSEPVRDLVMAAAVQVDARAEAEGEPVIAPLAGIFYRCPQPGEPPFTEAGSAIKRGDVVGIIEIMKLMNHVTAPCSGVVTKICVVNEELVGFGQVLAVIDPELIE